MRIQSTKNKLFQVIFSQERLSPASNKIHALLEAETPRSTAEVQSFLGMANFSSYFIQNYSFLTAPLRNLTNKSAVFNWTPETEQFFNTIRTALVQQPVMAYYDPERQTN